MEKFSKEEQRLVLLISACCLIATGVLLFLPGYSERVPLTRSKGDSEQDSETPSMKEMGKDGQSSLDSLSRGRKKPSESKRVFNPNFASYEDLLSIPGIGAVLARRIIHAREERIFFSPKDLMDIDGIGQKTWERMKPFIIFEARSSSEAPIDTKD